jgi:hypothetical protein
MKRFCFTFEYVLGNTRRQGAAHSEDRNTRNQETIHEVYISAKSKSRTQESHETQYIILHNWKKLNISIY